MMLRSAPALLLLALAAPASAQFEGIADLRMSGGEEGQKMEGKGKLFLTPSAWRMEMDMDAAQGAKGRKAAGLPPGQGPFRMVMFGKVATPKKSWMLNERTKTYAVIEDEGEGRAAMKQEAESWTITRLGEDKVAGFSCTNVKATRKGHDEVMEACMAKDFVSGAWLKAMRDTENEWWSGAATRAGVSGYPIRMIARTSAGAEKYRFEMVKVERKKLPGSLFEVPAGYKQGGMMDVMAQTPEQQRQMQEAQRQAAEAMKNMTPEQKKMMEEMMKKYGAGQRQ